LKKELHEKSRFLKLTAVKKFFHETIKTRWTCVVAIFIIVFGVWKQRLPQIYQPAPVLATKLKQS